MMQANAMQWKGVGKQAGVVNYFRLFEREARFFGRSPRQRVRACVRGILSESGSRSSSFSTWQSNPGEHATKRRCGRRASHNGRCGQSASLFLRGGYSLASYQTQQLLGAHGKADVILYA